MKRLFLLLIVFLLMSCTNNKPNNSTGDYQITISDKIINGSVISSRSSADTNDVVNLTIKASASFEIEKIYVNTTIIPNDKFYMPKCDVTIYAVFKKSVPNDACQHSYNEYLLKEASCKERGIMQYICANCDDAYSSFIDELKHNYENGECINCGNKDTEVINSAKTYLYELFGEDIDIYTNNEENPYNIDLNEYGSNVTAYFYEPNLDNSLDPYKNVSSTAFYKNYKRATTYEDAYFRTQHNLMSGDITDQYYKPTKDTIDENNQAVRLTDATYILDTYGNYLAYIPNVINTSNYIIFYEAAYTSLNDVAAYLLAFGSVPANTIADKNNTSSAIKTWGKYGRVNDSEFYGSATKFPFQPLIPRIKNGKEVRYNETDFGTTGGYTNENSLGTYYNQTVYNTGSSIKRGAARFVYLSDWGVKNIDDRHVFYTYNHYNDFEEYLNYHNGWGERFGNESAGNEYCGDRYDFYDLNCVPPTAYPLVLFKKYSEIMK